MLNDIKEIAEFEKLKAGNQGTNFTATQEEYETLLDMTGSSQSSNYLFVKNILDKEKLDTFLEILRYFVTSNNLDPHDERRS